MTDISARMRKTSVTPVRVLPDGSEIPLSPRPIRPMTDAEIEAAAASDPDNPVLTDAEDKRFVPMPRARTLRRA